MIEIFKQIWHNNTITICCLIILIIITGIAVFFYNKTDKKVIKSFYRTRWWNVFFILLISYGILFSFVFFNKLTLTPHTLFENLCIEVIGFCLGLLVSYIYYKRFYYEKVKGLLREKSFYTPFENLRSLTSELIIEYKRKPRNSKNSLSQSVSNEIITNTEVIQQKVILYQRFLELEEIASIDSCLQHAHKLINLDNNLEDVVYTGNYIHEVVMLYINTTAMTNKKLTYMEVEELFNLRKLIVKAGI